MAATIQALRLDFLDSTASADDRDLEDALMARLQAFLLQLGHGFALRPAAVGRVTGARQG